MDALVVVESSFGNTAAVADAVASGLRAAGAVVRVVTAAEAPIVPDADLLVVGAPTHNLGLPTAASRAQAIARGGTAEASGVAEWLASLGSLPGLPAAAYDTHVAGLFSGSAAKKIEKLLRGRGARVVGRAGFVVAGTPPQLAAGELDRARAWAAGLVASR